MKLKYFKPRWCIRDFIMLFFVSVGVIASLCDNNSFCVIGTPVVAVFWFIMLYIENTVEEEYQMDAADFFFRNPDDFVIVPETNEEERNSQK